LVRKTTSPSIIFIANSISTFTYSLVHAHIYTKRVRSNKPYLHPLYLLQTQHQCLLTVYFTHTHTKRIRSNKPHLNPSHSLQTQYQLPLTYYFMHKHNTSWIKQTASPSIIFMKTQYQLLLTLCFMHTRTHKASQVEQATSIATVSISTYRLFYAHTQSELGQTSHISIHLIANTTSASTYHLFYTHTKEARPNKSHPHHHIHCKLNINFYVPPIIYIHTHTK